MGIIPFQFINGQNAESLKLTGRELFKINIDDNLTVKQTVEIEVNIIRKNLFSHNFHFLSFTFKDKYWY